MGDTSDSDNGSVPLAVRLFGRQRPIHSVLGGGKVANVLLWRDTKISAAILIGIAAVWFLFEVVDYSLVTLLCHLFITTMLVIFISSSAAHFLNRDPANIPQIIFQDSAFRDFASAFLRKFNDTLANLIYVASGNDPRLFLLTIVSLWIISIIGSSISTLNLLFFGLVCLETLPFLYEKYEDEVDHLAYKFKRKIRKIYIKLEDEFFGRIPRREIRNKNN